MTIIILSVASFVAWFISTLAGGGSPMILIPLVNLLLGPTAIAPVITVGMLMGNSQRTWCFWEFIDWKVTAWYIPGAIVGAVLGAYTITQIDLEWLELIIGLFLIITVWSFRFGKKERTFNMNLWYFLPIGFFHAFSSGLIGSTGPITNPFYLNYGLVKETMVATKSSNVVIIHIAKIVSYISLGMFTPKFFFYGLLIGIASFPANWIGQKFLAQMNEEQFRQLVFILMGITGVWMLWQQRELLDIGQWIY